MAAVRFLIGGHRGMGKNLPPPTESAPEALKCPKGPYRPKVRENTVLSLAQAAEAGADFVEFDVQVTKDGVPVLFHDNLLWTKEDAGEIGRRIPDLTLEEFQRITLEAVKHGRLLRKTKDNTSYVWAEEIEAPMPTLRDVFNEAPPHLGFNIELKFPADDSVDVSDADVARMLDHVLPVVGASLEVQPRAVFFSSFVPDAVVQLKRRDPGLKVYFLTVGRPNLFQDERMNGIRSAIEVASSGKLDGIVAEADALLGEEHAVADATARGLEVLTWGDSNNSPSSLQLQVQKGVKGAIVDDVQTGVQARAQLS